jgi:hypothetical protein
MVSPGNIFTNVLAFGAVMAQNQFYETRLENDSSGKVLYAGITIVANGATDERIWYIVKMGYDGNGFVDRIQKPDGDFGLSYAWDSRATYFS